MVELENVLVSYIGLDNWRFVGGQKAKIRYLFKLKSSNTTKQYSCFCFPDIYIDFQISK